MTSFIEFIRASTNRFHSEKDALLEQLKKIDEDIQETVEKLEDNLKLSHKEAKKRYWHHAIERLNASRNEVRHLMLSENLDELTGTILREKNQMDNTAVRKALRGVIDRASIRLLALGNAHKKWDLSLTNPLRHAWWLPVMNFQNAQDVWETTRDLSQTIAQVRSVAEPRYLLKEASVNALIGGRQVIFSEVLDNYDDARWTSVGTLLCLQIEGLLLDTARHVDKKTIASHTLEIFDPGDPQKFLSKKKKAGQKLSSIRTLVLQSEYGDCFPIEYLEFFASDFYDDRCNIAHGNVIVPLSKDDVDIMVYALITTLNHRADLLNGEFPYGSPLK